MCVSVCTCIFEFGDWCVCAGDLTGPGGTAVNRKLSPENKFSLTDSGVTTDNETKNGIFMTHVYHDMTHISISSPENKFSLTGSGVASDGDTNNAISMTHL